MEWNNIEFNSDRCVDFTTSLSNEETTEITSIFGGIIRGNKKLAWIACNGKVSSMLQVVSVHQGYVVSRYTFNSSCDDNNRLEGYSIRCVEELSTSNLECHLLAVCLERRGKSEVTYIALFSVQSNRVVRYITLNRHVSCLAYMNVPSSWHNILKNFDGCLAVGSLEGNVMLLDVNIKVLQSKGYIRLRPQTAKKYVQAQLFDSTESLPKLLDNFRNCREQDLYFGLKLKVVDTSCAISSILPIGFVFSLAIGCEDGRIVMFDGTDVDCFVHISQKEQKTAVQSMTYLLPPGEMDTYVFLCAVHSSKSNLSVCLHKLSYDRRIAMTEQEDSFFLMNIQSCTLSLRMLLESTFCDMINCQSVKPFDRNAATTQSLCAICWHNVAEQKTKVVVFDLHQWLRENSPSVVNLSCNATYLIGYTLREGFKALHMRINPTSVVYMNFQQPFEEPLPLNALSFECALLMPNSFRIYYVVSAQRRFIIKLHRESAMIFLKPHAYHAEILRTRLLPKFCKQDFTSICSTESMCEVIFSVALEHNCLGLLRDFIKCWVRDTSVCNLANSDKSPSLLTLTNWIFKYAKTLTARCNDIYQHILYGLQANECEELHYLTRLMRQLVELQSEVLQSGHDTIPSEVLTKLSTDESAMRVTTDFHDVLNWLVRHGILSKESASNFPFVQLRPFYEGKRRFFSELSKDYISPVSGACRLLCIDALLQRFYEENSSLSEFWQVTGCIYPPASFMALLGIMRVPKLDFEQKCAVIFYCLLDLNSLHEIQCLKNFHLLLKLSSSLVHTVEIFWQLDHDKFEMAVDNYLSPIKHTYKGFRWQHDLIVESLLVQDAAELAQSLLMSETHAVSPMLQLKTLLANDAVWQAFELARSAGAASEQPLLSFFFCSCIKARNLNVLINLMLNPDEEQLLQQALRENTMSDGMVMYVLYLLKKSKVVEAIFYENGLSRTNASDDFCDNNRRVVATLLNSYKGKMSPITQDLADFILRFHNQFCKKTIDSCNAKPLSCELRQLNPNTLPGGVYQSAMLSVLSIDSADQSKDDRRSSNTDHLWSTSNAPFLRKHSIIVKQNERIVVHQKPERTFTERPAFDFKAFFEHANSTRTKNNQNDVESHDASLIDVQDKLFNSSSGITMDSSPKAPDLKGPYVCEQSKRENNSEDELSGRNATTYESFDNIERSDNEDIMSDNIWTSGTSELSHAEGAEDEIVCIDCTEELSEMKIEVVCNETQESFQEAINDAQIVQIKAASLPTIPEEEEELEVTTLENDEDDDIVNLTNAKQNGRRCLLSSNVGSEEESISTMMSNTQVLLPRRSPRIAALNELRQAQKQLSESTDYLQGSTGASKVEHDNKEKHLVFGSPAPRTSLRRRLNFTSSDDDKPKQRSSTLLSTPRGPLRRSNDMTTTEATPHVGSPKPSVVRKLFPSETLPGNEPEHRDYKEHLPTEIQSKRALASPLNPISKGTSPAKTSKNKNAKLHQQLESPGCRTRAQCAAAKRMAEFRDADDNNSSESE